MMPREPIGRSSRHSVRQWRVTWMLDFWTHPQSRVYSHEKDARYRYRKLQDTHIFGLAILRLELRVLWVDQPWKTVKP